MIPDTIEIKISELLEHSKLGIASVIIAAIVFIYFFVAGYIVLYGLDNVFSNSNSVAALGIMVFAFFIHLAVCCVGLIVGSALAIVGLIKKDKKRLFPVAGLILNFLPLISAVIYTLYFFVGVENSK